MISSNQTQNFTTKQIIFLKKNLQSQSKHKKEIILYEEYIKNINMKLNEYLNTTYKQNHFYIILMILDEIKNKLLTTNKQLQNLVQEYNLFMSDFTSYPYEQYQNDSISLLNQTFDYYNLV